MTDIIHINPREPEPELIAQAVDHLRAGRVVAYPTETFYGLAVDFHNDRAIKRLYDLKRRDPGLPIALLVADMSMLGLCVKTLPKGSRALIKNFWPGPLTICFPAAPIVSKNLMTNTGKIGIRISSHPVATALVKAFGHPLTTTSANLSGYPASMEPKHVEKYFGDRLDCIVAAGECAGLKGSTVVDISEETMAVIRDGAIPAEQVIECFQAHA